MLCVAIASYEDISLECVRKVETMLWVLKKSHLRDNYLKKRSCMWCLMFM